MKCPKCGHDNYDAKHGYCIEVVSQCKHLKARCGCQCDGDNNEQAKE